jgi:N-acetylglutamate synthase-like GNAT family acetyltransferase
MQIRIGNKQDEPLVRELVQRLTSELAVPFDLNTSESDLKNIEKEYIGNDGIYLVVEEDNAIVGFAAARKLNDDICEIRRMIIGENHRGRGLGKELVKHIVSFARGMDYRYLDVIMDPRFPIGKKLMDDLDFHTVSKSDSEVYRHALSPRC